MCKIYVGSLLGVDVGTNCTRPQHVLVSAFVVATIQNAVTHARARAVENRSKLRVFFFCGVSFCLSERCF